MFKMLMKFFKKCFSIGLLVMLLFLCFCLTAHAGIIPGDAVHIDFGDNPQYLYETLLPDATSTFTANGISLATQTVVTSGTTSISGIATTLQNPPCAVVVFATFTSAWAGTAYNCELLATISGTSHDDQYIGDTVIVTTCPIDTSTPGTAGAYTSVAFKNIAQIKIRAGGHIASAGAGTAANNIIFYVGRASNLIDWDSDVPRRIYIQNQDGTDLVRVSDSPKITSTAPHVEIKPEVATEVEDSYETYCRKRLWATTADAGSGSVITGVIERRE